MVRWKSKDNLSKLSSFYHMDPISELGHQALVTSVPRSEPSLSLLNESCILFGALTTRGDQYVFLNEDSNCVPFPVCTKFLFFETMQNYFPSTL